MLEKSNEEDFRMTLSLHSTQCDAYGALVCLNCDLETPFRQKRTVFQGLERKKELVKLCIVYV
jgi:hypothetical protein